MNVSAFFLTLNLTCRQKPENTEGGAAALGPDGEVNLIENYQ